MTEEKDAGAVDPSSEGVRSIDVRVCPACHQTSPTTLTSCWKCGANLVGGRVWQVAEEVEQKKKPLEAPSLPESSLDRRTLSWEVVMVLLVTWLPQGIAGIEHMFTPAPRAAAEIWWEILGPLGRIALILYLLGRDRLWLDALGISRLRWVREVGWGVVILAVAMILEYLAVLLSLKLGLPYWNTENDTLEEFQQARWLLPVVLLIAATSEEVFYRAYLLTRLTQVLGGPGRALIVSSVLFALAHGYSPASTFDILVAGILYGAIFIVCPRLPRLVLAHWGWNLIVTYFLPGHR